MATLQAGADYWSYTCLIRKKWSTKNRPYLVSTVHEKSHQHAKTLHLKHNVFHSKQSGSIFGKNPSWENALEYTRMYCAVDTLYSIECHLSGCLDRDWTGISVHQIPRNATTEAYHVSVGQPLLKRTFGSCFRRCRSLLNNAFHPSAGVGYFKINLFSVNNFSYVCFLICPPRKGGA